MDKEFAWVNLETSDRSIHQHQCDWKQKGRINQGLPASWRRRKEALIAYVRGIEYDYHCTAILLLRLVIIQPSLSHMNNILNSYDLLYCLYPSDLLVRQRELKQWNKTDIPLLIHPCFQITFQTVELITSNIMDLFSYSYIMIYYVAETERNTTINYL